MFSKTWLFDALERAAKTAAQFVLVALGQDVGGIDLFAVDFENLAGLALGGAVVSLLTSVVSAPVGGNETASVVPAPPGPVATEA